MFSDRASSDVNMNHGEPWCSENPIVKWFVDPRSADEGSTTPGIRSSVEATRILSGIGLAQLVAWHPRGRIFRRDQQAHKWVSQDRWETSVFCRMVISGSQNLSCANARTRYLFYKGEAPRGILA